LFIERKNIIHQIFAYRQITTERGEKSQSERQAEEKERAFQYCPFKKLS
jgi:ferredoxin